MTNTINLRPVIENILIKINSAPPLCSGISIDYREFYYKKPFGGFFIIYRKEKGLNTKLKKEFTLESVLKFLENLYNDLNKYPELFNKKITEDATHD